MSLAMKSTVRTRLRGRRLESTVSINELRNGIEFTCWDPGQSAQNHALGCDDLNEATLWWRKGIIASFEEKLAPQVKTSS